MINTFSSNLNSLNLHLKIRPWPFYKIMKGFILKINSKEISKVASFSVPFMLNLTWGIDVLFEKLTVETEVWIWEKNPFHNASGGGDFLQSLSFFEYI